MSAKLTRAYLEAVRACTPEDCGDCILKPTTNRACHMVDVDPRDEAALALRLREELEDTVIIAGTAMCEANNDGAGYDVEATLAAARALLAELEG